jgi:CRISPR-associated protein Csm3
MGNKKLLKKKVITKQLEILTGLHIGSSSESVEIGGVDKPVVRRTIDNIPYIPGSSIKGKMRSLLEQIAGSAEVGGNDEINEVFGFAAKNKPSKILVRDAEMAKESIEKLRNSDYTDMPDTEIKFENSIDRVKGTALNPRQIERVPAGSKFIVEFVINVWGETKDNTDLAETEKILLNGIKALENDYLGGNGSRGYGKVVFHDLKSEEIDFKDYLKNTKND